MSKAPQWMNDASSGPEQYSAPEPASAAGGSSGEGSKASMHAKMKATPLGTVLRYLRMSNFVNGLLSGTAAILAFLSIPGFTNAFQAVYLM